MSGGFMGAVAFYRHACPSCWSLYRLLRNRSRKQSRSHWSSFLRRTRCGGNGSERGAMNNCTRGLPNGLHSSDKWHRKCHLWCHLWKRTEYHKQAGSPKKNDTACFVFWVGAEEPGLSRQDKRTVPASSCVFYTVFPVLFPVLFRKHLSWFWAVNCI